MKQKNYLFQKYKIGLLKAMFIISLLISSISLFAQNQVTVRGTVTDSGGEALIGVSINEKGTQNSTITNVNGNFSLTVGSNSTIVVTYIGFARQEIPVNGRTNISVILREQDEMLEQVVIVGYGVKKKETLAGAVSAVTGDEISTTKNQNMQNMLTGKLPGIRVYQKTAEPGAFSGNFDIRGFGTPLVVIDGFQQDNLDIFRRLDPNEIENLSILKDASASVYGVRAANGVIIVTTKQGLNTDGKTTLKYTGSMGWQWPSGSPKSTTAAEWMTLRNERIMRNVDQNNAPPYSQELIQEYLDGKRTSYDWWDICMRAAMPETMHNLNISGGNNKVTYFVSGSYSYAESFLRSESYNYGRYNLRSNVTANVTDRLKFSLNMSGIMDKRNQALENSDWVIRSMQRVPATMPPYVWDDPRYPYYGIIEGENPLTMSSGDITGKRIDQIKNFNAKASASYKVPYINGLTANASYGFGYRMNDNKNYRRAHELFRPDEANEDTKGVISRGFRQSPSRVRRDFSSRTNILYNLSLDYKNKFNNKHNLGALLLWEGSRRQTDNFYAQRELSMYIDHLFAGNSQNQEGYMSFSEDNFHVKTNQALVGRLEYDYNSKYLFEFAFRNDGSSVWDEAGRWGFFPSFFGAWRVSEESFWKNSQLEFVNNFKLRGSYGEMGDDDPASGYTWLQGWNYPAVSGNWPDASGLRIGNNRLPNGYYFDGTFVTAVSNRGITNPSISWVVAKVLNFGVDADAWRGLFGASFDYFRRDRSGQLSTRTGSLSSTLGASMPQENLNSDRQQGFELELRHRNRINDFNYSVTGMVSYTRNMRLYREIAPAGNSWLNYTQYNNQNRYQGIHAGRGADGRFQSYEEIANSLVFYGRGTLPGDYIYLDWNGDGRIDNLDNHPLTYEQNATPVLYFSLNMNVDWRGFDLTMLWQGAGLSSIRYAEQLYEPMWGSDNSNALAFFLDRWHPTIAGANPYEHNTQWIPGYFAATGSMPNSDSEFNLYNTAYMRLKTIELGYSLPGSIVKKAGIQGARIYVNGYNMFTIQNKNLIADPEHTSDAYSNAYPLAKSFSFGVNLKF